MDKYRLIKCDWKNCGSFAAIHLRYGYSPYPDKKPAVGFHGDYCWRHTDYIEEYFTTTDRVPIGKCPDACGFGGMRVVSTVTGSSNSVGKSVRGDGKQVALSRGTTASDVLLYTGIK